MEIMEGNTTEVGKKLWNLLRVVFFMLRKGISKSRIMIDLNLLLKRGNKLAGKAICNLIDNHHHHVASLSCRSNDAVSFISPREYEFSCSSSPANVRLFYTNNYRRKHHYHHHHGHGHGQGQGYLSKSYKYNDVTTVAAVQKMLEMLNNEMAVESSPVTYFPGFGKSPMVRQLRITDSPFPLKDDDADSRQVDMAAEEFIKKFYKDLKSQKNKSVLESPYHQMRAR